MEKESLDLKNIKNDIEKQNLDLQNIKTEYEKNNKKLKEENNKLKEKLLKHYYLLIWKLWN